LLVYQPVDVVLRAQRSWRFGSWCRPARARTSGEPPGGVVLVAVVVVVVAVIVVIVALLLLSLLSIPLFIYRR